MGLMVFAGQRRENQAGRVCHSREGRVVHERVAEMRFRNYEEIKDFVNDNKVFSIFVVVLLILCIIGECWILSRIISGSGTGNENGHLNTGVTMERIETGIESAGKRVDSITNSISETEKAVGGAAAAVSGGRENAETIANGIDECEKRLDDIKQGIGRIKNLMSDIENANRTGAARSPAASVAK